METEKSTNKASAKSMKWTKKHVTRFELSFMDSNERDMVALVHLQKQPNKNGFIKNLLFEDSKKEKLEKEKN